MPSALQNAINAAKAAKNNPAAITAASNSYSSTGNDTFAKLFQNGALRQYGLTFQGDGSEGPNTPYWQSAGGDNSGTAASIARLQPYMDMSGAELMAAWPSLPADIKDKLGATPEEFAEKVSYKPDGRGGWENTFVEKTEFMERALPIAMSVFMGGALGGYLPGGANFAGGAGLTTGQLGTMAGVNTSAAGAMGGGLETVGGLTSAAGAGAGAGALGSDAWFEQLMQNFNPDLGFQGLNEAGAGLTGGMTGGASKIDWSQIDKMIENLGPNALEAENLVTAQSIAEASGLTIAQAKTMIDAATKVAGAGAGGAMDEGVGTKEWMDSLNKSASESDWLTTALKGLTTGGGGTDLLKTLITGGAGLFQDYQKSEQADKLYDLAERYEGYRAPSLARYEASYAPGFSMSNDPGFQDALNQSAKGTMHALSAGTGANPFGSPNAWGASLQDLYQKNAYPALQQYRNQNALSGGVANASASAPNIFGQAINAESQVGAGTAGAVGSIFNPPSSLQDLLRQLRGLGGT